MLYILLIIRVEYAKDRRNGDGPTAVALSYFSIFMRRVFAVANIFVFTGPTPYCYNNSRKVSAVSTRAVSVSSQYTGHGLAVSFYCN
jgi:hypothetical protein